MQNNNTSAGEWAAELAGMETGELRAELATVYDEGCAPAGWREALERELAARDARSAAPTLSPEQWATVRDALVLDYLELSPVSPDGVALARIINEIVAVYPAGKVN